MNPERSIFASYEEAEKAKVLDIVAAIQLYELLTVICSRA